MTVRERAHASSIVISLMSSCWIIHHLSLLPNNHLPTCRVPSNYLSRNIGVSSYTRSKSLLATVVASQQDDSSTNGAGLFLPAHDSPTTLTRFLLENIRSSKAPQDIVDLISSIQFACKKIASLVSRAGVTNLTGLYNEGKSLNIQGEEQKKLDVLSNQVLKNALKYSGKMGVIASEEEDVPVTVDESFSGTYVAVFDPLDGSSNLDAAVATGTIFGIFKQAVSCLVEDDADNIEPSQLRCLANTLQPGSRLLAAGYCMYSSSTMMVLSLGHGTHGFTLDHEVGEFVLTHPNMKIPKRGQIYSLNEANYHHWDPVLKEYVENLKSGKNRSGKSYSLRYIGSLVADVHRTLLYGGIFGYPGDKKNPNGKLRLLYECAPMSYLIEQAGGKATNGKQRILDIVPNTTHERQPLILGSEEDVDELMQLYAAKLQSKV
jgi:fructose-1,6-bisphosphatase I